jgi:divalent metal cation (Fe/Co/Zn/Cd) transporter
MKTTTQGNNTQQLFKAAFGLAVFTIVYNIIEGLVSTLLGFSDESLALFGFGADSFIETISGVGILHMVTRIRANPNSNRDQYERTALKITGFSFFALVLALTATAVFNIVTDQEPETTFWGIVISIISISIMWVLVVYKRKIGKLLNSDAIIADAECTKVCIYMSLVLLVSSGLYYFIKLPYIDSVGALILAYLSFREGRECFEKAKSDKYCACDHN